MFLKKLGKRGVAMTEYAILLAFVAAVGASFTSDNGLASSIKDAVGKAENAINLVMGKSAYRYDTKTTEADAKYKAALDSLINGLYDDLSQEGMPLKQIWINSDGSIQKYLLYNENSWDTWHSYQGSTGPNVNQYLPSDYQHTGGQSHIYFTEDGNIMNSYNDVNGVSRVYITGINNSPLWYNTNNGDFGSSYHYFND